MIGLEAAESRYELRARIGVGAHGVVFRAHDHQLGRDVAIKRFSHALADDPETMRRISREVRNLAQVTHPNVVTVYDLVTLPDGEGESTPHLIMELVDGRSLKQLLADRGPSLKMTEVVRGVLAGLAACHAAGVLHLDVKPANVLVLPGGGVKLVDFGIARAASDPTATVAGTPPYMPPEQAEGRWDERSDVYAVGCLLYECLTGRPPFDGPAAQQLMAHRHDPRPDPSVLAPGVSPALASFVQRAMAVDPGARFASAHDMLGGLTATSSAPAPIRSSGPATEVHPAVGAVSPVPRNYGEDSAPTAITEAVAAVPSENIAPYVDQPRVRRRDRWATAAVSAPLAALIVAIVPAIAWGLSSFDPASQYRGFVFDENDGLILWGLSMVIASAWLAMRRREIFDLVAGPPVGSVEPSGWQSAPARRSRWIALAAGVIGSIPMILPWYVAGVVAGYEAFAGDTPPGPEDDIWSLMWVFMPAVAIFLAYAAVRRLRLRIGSLMLSMIYFAASAGALVLFVVYPTAFA